MSYYLYGASVQGIQDFIFKTNKLQEIVGASEMVKSIDNMIEDYAPDEILVQAAGNIKAVFSTKPETLVREFPKKVMQQACGITISQAVVEIASEEPTKEELRLLEQHLKAQRNVPSIPLDMHINVLSLTRTTARPIWGRSKEQPDMASQQKRNAYEQWFKESRIDDTELEKSKELSYLSNGKNKIAVIHADGNGLGELIPHLKEKTGLSLKEFSKNLDIATHEAYNRAKEGKEKIRPIVLGGDDMTVVCDANIALEFTKDFLAYFEEATQKHLKHKLTACAGIAFCNHKYPMHYALHVAEALTSETKKHAKALKAKHNYQDVPSSLMFHNIQSSNFQAWDKFIQDELTINNDSQTIRLDFGPYYINDLPDQARLQDFIHTVEAYRCDHSPISRLRSWLGELHKDAQGAKDMLARINIVTQEKEKWNCEIMNQNLKFFHKELSQERLIIPKDGASKTPIYDVLQILSVTEPK